MYPTLFDAGELELLENEAEQQGETGEAVRNAVESEPLGIPAHVADAAVTTAAKVYAPSLPISPMPSAASPQPQRTGRWVRRGDRIIALDTDPTA
jgi:hypothetical protein